jgi:hypothetical protein
METISVQPELDLFDQFFSTTNQYTYVDDDQFSEVFLPTELK